MTVIPSTAAVRINVNRLPPPTVNTPPEAKIVFNGPTPRVTEFVTVYGEGSTDADGDQIYYAWSVTSPNGNETKYEVANPNFEIDQSGDYIVQLTVTDLIDFSNTETLTISTENTPPVADAGQNETFEVGGSVVLDGSNSTDVDSPDTLTYLWSIDNQPTGSNAMLSDETAVKPTLEVDSPGDYIVILIVHDGMAYSEPDMVTLTANEAPPTNSPPVADAGPGSSVIVGDSVTLDGSGSSDANGDQLTYQWSITTRPDGSQAILSNSSSATAGFVSDAAGTYVAQLIVNDGTVPSSPDTVTLTATDAPSDNINTPPVSDAGQDDAVAVGDTVTLDGSGSSDADSDLLTFTWSFNSVPDGSTAEIAPSGAVAPSFEADMAGLYVVQLIVNDGTDNSEPKTVEVTVSSVEPPATPPVVTLPSGDDEVEIEDDGEGEIEDDRGRRSYKRKRRYATPDTAPVIETPVTPPVIESSDDERENSNVLQLRYFRSYFRR